ncbi:MAG: AAA family ATPase, partial [Gemmatimonadota bacterium]|nr:AAA family ATPase [Gemmatimonadota bacterium]
MFDSGGSLDHLTRDLTAEARAGKLEAVCCREEEISRVIDILLRQSKNNPALVGPAGVGKTAVAEGLAHRIASGDVPLTLRSARVLALDHVSMMAGTMYRGQFEERMKELVERASADPDIILFIDELHNLIGQGTAIGVSMDAANMLKPALVRGEFRVIGATTDDEYEKWVCGDPALERRFQKVAVRELSAEQTLTVLQTRKDRLERHHNVAIADDALRASIMLTDLFVTDRARPDRAIDALDEACAHTQATAAYTPLSERLILERRELVRSGALKTESAPAEAAREKRNAEQGEADPLDRWARESFAALERFGAELEAAFTAKAPTAAAAEASPEPQPPPAPSAEPRPAASSRRSPAERLA